MEEMRLPSNMGFHSDAPNTGAPVSFTVIASRQARRFLRGESPRGVRASLDFHGIFLG
jgi:hypothetical protein